MTREEAIEKVKKLLALGGSSNPHEAGLALTRAREIAIRFALDLEAIRREAGAPEIGRLDRRHRMRSFEEAHLLGLIELFFRVRTLAGVSTITFIGTESDVRLADYAFGFLLRSIRQALAEWREGLPASTVRSHGRSAKRRNDARRSFVRGWVAAVGTHLQQQEEDLRAGRAWTQTGMDLVLRRDPRVDAAMKQLFPNVQQYRAPKVEMDERAAAHGFRAGSQVRLRTAIETPSRPATAAPIRAAGGWPTDLFGEEVCA